MAIKKKIAEEAPLPLRSVHSVRISSISRRESKEYVNDAKKVLCQERCRCGYGGNRRVERNCLWVKIHGGHSRHIHQSERGGQLGG